MPTPLPRIHVLVDLERSSEAGGHVKCWERIAEAAARSAAPLDLTVHFQGRPGEIITLSDNIRLWLHRPILSSGSFAWMDVGADSTDLAPFHPGLFAALRDADVIHATDAYFAYARTAALASRIYGTPMSASVHTDTPAYTRIYSERVFRRLAGGGKLCRFLTRDLALPARLERRMRRQLCRQADGTADFLMPASGHEWLREVSTRLGAQRVMSRGIDSQRFSPDKRDRAELQRRFGIPAHRPVIAFAGRVDRGKGVDVLAQAMRSLLRDETDVHLVVAGEGMEVSLLRRTLGDRVACTGYLEQDDLAWLMASADLFVFPSRIEVSPNVVLEAKASGLPVIAAPEGGGHYIRPGIDGIVVPETHPRQWADATALLLADPARRSAMSAAARIDIIENRPTWEHILLNELLPLWERASTQRRKNHVWHQNSSADTAPGR